MEIDYDEVLEAWWSIQSASKLTEGIKFSGIGELGEIHYTLSFKFADDFINIHGYVFPEEL